MVRDRIAAAVKEIPGEKAARGERDKAPAAIVLAAGYASRMEAFKALLPLGKGAVLPPLDMPHSVGARPIPERSPSDGTVFDRVIQSLQEGGVKRILVVTGYRRERLAPYLEKYGLEEAYNADFDRGMFSSIQAGLRQLIHGTTIEKKTDTASGAIAEGEAGCFLVPVDCPLFGADTIALLRADLLTGGRENFVVPTYRGKKGHPLFVPGHHFEEILTYRGKDGLKAITDKYFLEMRRVETDREGILLDMDTRGAYEEVKEFLAGGCVSEDLAALAAGRRFCLVRHGQIRQHEEKIFLGRTDVPLSDMGRQQAAAAGRQVEELHLETDRVYTSDLCRAAETAHLLKNDRILVEVPGFREMSLGAWEGLPIRQVQEEEPDAFRLRGENLWSYKTGAGSENFFDLQYRVVKALCTILKKDPRRDVLIVAHRGVLRVLENNLRGKDVTAPWEEMANGQVRVLEQQA